jgi:DNA replication and repair protein RecF
VTVQVDRLSTCNFRNLCDVSLELQPRFNLICGDNAQGKTNLLEAIDLTFGHKPFRATRTAELIQFDTDAASVSAQVSHGALEHEVKLRLTPKGRTLKLDGKPMRSASSWPRGLTSVLFTPDDLLVPKGAPGERRRLLDRAVANVWPAYAELGRAYTRALSSRNRVLRDRPAAADSLLDVYDQQLSKLGARVIVARQRYIRALRDDFTRTYRGIDKRRFAELVYVSQLDIDDDEADWVSAQVEVQLAERLASERRSDFARGSTGSGPHHDDVTFRLDGRPARVHASQGQVRALVLAFKMAQIHNTFEVFGHYPALLLDDVSSELDAHRNEQLFDFMSHISCQLFVTTTRPELIPAPSDALYLNVIKGEISTSFGS